MLLQLKIYFGYVKLSADVQSCIHLKENTREAFNVYITILINIVSSYIFRDGIIPVELFYSH